MGALARLMPITAVTFLVGWLSIGGVPPFSGFWSKGDVLLNAYAFSPALWAVGALTAVLTAYYMGRAYLLVFRGEQRWVEARGARRTATARRLRPARPVLGDVAAARRARRPVRARRAHQPALPPDLRLPRPVAEPGVRRTPARSTSWSIGSEWAFALIDAALARARRRPRGRALGPRPPSARPLEPTFLRRAWYIDWAYDRFIARPSTEVAVETSSVVETKGIDGAVNGVAGLVRATGRQLRKVQTGYVRNYALGLTAGLVLDPRLRADEGVMSGTLPLPHDARPAAGRGGGRRRLRPERPAPCRPGRRHRRLARGARHRRGGHRRRSPPATAATSSSPATSGSRPSGSPGASGWTASRSSWC